MTRDSRKKGWIETQKAEGGLEAKLGRRVEDDL
jgi:hypothetical protein